MKKRFLACFLAVLMTLALAACGGGTSSSVSTDSQAAPAAEASTSAATPAAEGGKTKITVLRPGDQEPVSAFMEPAIEQFMADNPDIEVEIMYESWGGWIQTYATLFENDTQPDVIFWWDNKLNDSSAAGRLQPLNDVVDQEVFDKLPQSYWDIGSIGTEETYYIPSSVDPFMLYYNKDVFTAAGLDPESPPTTWSELLAACEAISANTDVPALGVPAKAGMDTLQEFVALFITQKTGTDLLDKDNNPTFNTPEGVEALEYLSELFKYQMPSTTDYGRGDLRPLVRDGQVGIHSDATVLLHAHRHHHTLAHIVGWRADCHSPAGHSVYDFPKIYRHRHHVRRGEKLRWPSFVLEFLAVLPAKDNENEHSFVAMGKLVWKRAVAPLLSGRVGRAFLRDQKQTRAHPGGDR